MNAFQTYTCSSLFLTVFLNNKILWNRKLHHASYYTIHCRIFNMLTYDSMWAMNAINSTVIFSINIDLAKFGKHTHTFTENLPQMKFLLRCQMIKVLLLIKTSCIIRVRTRALIKRMKLFASNFISKYTQ